MAFVNEVISEADKSKYGAFNFKSPFTGDPVSPRKWAIDRERDAFLVSLGGRGGERSEIPAFFVLVWKGEVIRFDAFTKGRGDAQSGVEKWWNIFAISIPKHLESQREEILQLIREAIEVCGQHFDRAYVKAVHIGIAPVTVF
jgi:hypothetical protein